MRPTLRHDESGTSRFSHAWAAWTLRYSIHTSIGASCNVTKHTVLGTNKTGREELRAMFRTSLLHSAAMAGPAVASCGLGIRLGPCNFMLDLSSQRPPKFVHFHPHLFCQPPFAVKTSFRFFLASFFTSRAGSRSLSLSNTIITITCRPTLR